MILAYIDGVGAPIMIEHEDVDYFMNTESKNHHLDIRDPENKIRYWRKRGSKSESNREDFIVDPDEIERAIKYERYPIVDMKYSGLINRNVGIYSQCVVKKNKNINDYLNFEDKINILLSILINPKLNYRESFSIIESTPPDEEVTSYMNRLAYLINEDQKQNGEISNVNALMERAYYLAEIKDYSLDEIKSRSNTYKRYMRFLLTKDEYINITREDLEFAITLHSVVRDNIRELESITGINNSYGVTSKEVIYNDVIKIGKIAYGIAEGPEIFIVNFIKFLDCEITKSNVSEIKEKLLLDMGLLIAGVHEIKKIKITTLVVDKNLSTSIYSFGGMEQSKKNCKKLLDTITNNLISSNIRSVPIPFIEI